MTVQYASLLHPTSARRLSKEEFVHLIPAFAGMACGGYGGAVPGEDFGAIRFAIAPYFALTGALLVSGVIPAKAGIQWTSLFLTFGAIRFAIAPEFAARESAAGY